MYKSEHTFTYLVLKESVANYVINVLLFAWMSGGIVCRPVSMLKAVIWNITYDCYSQNNSVKIAALQWLLLFSFAVNVNEQRIIAFLTEKYMAVMYTGVCTARVHGCSRRVRTRYTAVHYPNTAAYRAHGRLYGLCTRPSTAVYGPCTRPCTGRAYRREQPCTRSTAIVHGLYMGNTAANGRLHFP